MQFVTLTQYLRPDGRTREVLCEVPNSNARHAQDMVLSCEVLTDGRVAIYGRFSDEPEEEEVMRIASNRPSHRNTNPPDVVVSNVIETVWERRFGTNHPLG